MTDCWHGYDRLTAEGFEHLKVNYSQNFVDPNTWAHTQNIKSNVIPLKREITKTGIKHENMAMHLCEYLWLGDIKIMRRDPFISFIDAMARIYPDN